MEFYHNDQWVSLLNITGRQKEQAVVGCGDPGRFSEGVFSGRKDGYEVNCGDSESSVTECTLGEYNGNNNDPTEEVFIESSGESTG